VIGRGLFATWQPQYAQIGLATFPVQGKKPAVRGYLHLGLRASHHLTSQFPSADAFGVALGARNNLTILDVDTSDKRVLTEALDQHGNTPFIVRSGRGYFQAWYRYNGERRLIRPFPDLPVDILGAGFVVAPPSQVGAGSYEIIQGSLSDLQRLPIMRVREDYSVRGRERHSLPVGSRNDNLFRYALQQARHVDDRETLLDVVSTENDHACQPPLAETEIARIVASAWRCQSEGRNFVGGNKVYVTFEEIDKIANADPDALVLLMVLRRFHYGRREFALGKAMALKLNWTLPRFRAARQCLEVAGRIKCRHAGGRGPNDPPVYSLLA
jgi:ribosomal protein L37AE/L43A